MRPVYLLLLVTLTRFSCWSQESHGDNKLDLYQSQNWEIEDFKIYKLDQKEPHQLLVLGSEMIYLFTHFKSGENGPKYVHIELDNWMKNTDRLALEPNFTDQSDHNNAWQTNMIEAKEILRGSNIHKFANFQKAKKSEKFCWLSEDYSIYNELGDHYFSMQTENHKNEFKSKLFKDHYIVAQNLEIGLGQHVLIGPRSDKCYLFCPTSTKTKKNDFTLQNEQFSGESQFHFIFWTSQEKKDLLEITDSSIVLYQIIDQQITDKKIIFHSDTLIEIKEIRNQDINGDGTHDLILNGEKPFVLFNYIDAAVFHSLGLEACDPEGLSIADVNNDGQPDLLINAHYGLVICYNDHGNFQKNQTIGFGNDIAFYFLSDIDKDGTKELLLKDCYQSKLFQCSFENNMFTQPQPLEMFWD